METILIAEDDRIFLARLIRELKKHRGRFNVEGVHNGQQAIDILEKRPASVVVTDIQMPQVDGLQLLAHVNNRHPAIPCFAMTAYQSPGLRQQLQQDALRFFAKPFDPQSLGAAIVETIDQDAPSGVLRGISVVSFLIMIERERKSCLFEVHIDNGPKGLFFFNEGVLFDAVCGNRRGTEAALELISRHPAQFRFRQLPDEKVPKRIGARLETLIEEAIARVNDKAIGEALDTVDFDIPEA